MVDAMIIMVDAMKQATGTLVDCKSVFVIHVKSYKLQRQFMLRSRERGNIQLLNGMCREAQECIRHD